MKILVTEDSESKIALIKKLIDSCIPEEYSTITIARCLVEARDHLTKNHVDLLICDLVIPNRLEDEPEPDGGITLIEEIISSRILSRPTCVIGLTAHEDAESAYRARFHKHLWHVIKFDPSNNQWAEQLRERIEYIFDSQRRVLKQATESFNYDVGFVCALPDPELRALLTENCNWKIKRIPGESIIFHIGSMMAGNHQLRLVAASQSEMGNVSAAILTERIIRYFHPRLMVMTGICAGADRTSQSLLDIVIAEEAFLHDSGKLVSRPTIELIPDPRSNAISADIKSLLQSPKITGDILSSIQDTLGSSTRSRLVAHLGPLGSGNSVISTEDVVTKIKSRFRKLKGIEMEGYGFSYSCANSTLPPPSWIIIKSICDFADSAKEDSQQNLASSVSARFAIKLIEVAALPPYNFFKSELT